MRHVDHEIGAGLPGDRRKALEVDDARIGRRARDEQLGLAFERDLPHLVVVDDLGDGVDAVGDELIVLAREVHGGAVGQVAAVGKAHAQHGVARLEQREIDREVRLRASVGLHVRVLRAEELLGALDGDVFHLVDVLAAAVIPLGGVALGVLVGEHRAHRGEHRGADDVLRSDQLDVAALPGQLPSHRRADLGVGFGDEPNRVHHVLIHHNHPFRRRAPAHILSRRRARTCTARNPAGVRRVPRAAAGGRPFHEWFQYTINPRRRTRGSGEPFPFCRTCAKLDEVFCALGALVCLSSSGPRRPPGKSCSTACSRWGCCSCSGTWRPTSSLSIRPAQKGGRRAPAFFRMPALFL